MWRLCLTLVVCGVVIPLANCNADDLRITIAACAEEIRECDPLFVRVTVKNDGQEPAVFQRPLTASLRNVLIEITDRGGSDYSNLPVNGSCIFQCSENRPLMIKENETYHIHEVAFFSHRRDPQGFAFAAPGEYQLRAGVRVEDSVVYSEPIMLTITHRTKEERDFIVSHQGELEQIIDVRMLSGHLSSEQITALEDGISDGVLDTTLRWSRCIIAFDAADDRDARREAVNAIEELTMNLDPITESVIAMNLGWRYAELHNSEGLEHIFRELPGRSFDRSVFASELGYRDHSEEEE